jgi:hypothetical protein
MQLPTVLDRLVVPTAGGRRPRHRLAPEVGLLEDRQLLSGGVPAPTATMTQTATFPNLEAMPNAATQAFLYFSSTIGTLTEVDVVTSGSYTTQFNAENLGASSSNITGTTRANLSINVPSGSIPLAVPAVTESFTAGPYDGSQNDAAASGRQFAPESSSSATQTTVLTSPAALADFTGEFRIPVTVSGHAIGSASSSNGQLSDNFTTQTSATITIVYHYVPNLGSPTGGTPSSGSPSSGSPTSSSPSPTSTPPSTGTTGIGQTPSTSTQSTAKHSILKKQVVAASHKVAHHASTSHVRPASHVHSSRVKPHSK